MSLFQLLKLKIGRATSLIRDTMEDISNNSLHVSNLNKDLLKIGG